MRLGGGEKRISLVANKVCNYAQSSRTRREVYDQIGMGCDWRENDAPKPKPADGMASLPFSDSGVLANQHFARTYST